MCIEGGIKDSDTARAFQVLKKVSEALKYSLKWGRLRSQHNEEEEISTGSRGVQWEL
jgi:hypothetical protein